MQDTYSSKKFKAVGGFEIPKIQAANFYRPVAKQAV